MAPFVSESRSDLSPWVFLIALVLSAIASVVYLIGARTFLSKYSRPGLSLAFGPFILATLCFGTLGVVYLVAALAHWNIL